MAAASRWMSTPKTKKSALEVIFTVLHAGGKFEAGNYKTAGGLHGVGASVVNALSRELTATVRRDGAQWEMSFRQGKPTGALKKTGAARGSGTTVFFRPDPTIFPKVEFDAQTIRERLEVASYLHRGVKVTFEDESDRPQGRLSARRRPGRLPEEDRRRAPGEADSRRAVRPREGERGEAGARAAVDGVHRRAHPQLRQRHSHRLGRARTRTGCAPASGKAVRNYIDTHNLAPKGVTLTADDIREGVTGILSVFIQEPQFQGQTKDRLNNPEVLSAVDGMVRPALEHWMNNNQSIAEAIVARIILAARAREASRAAQQEVVRKGPTSGRVNLPGKLSDCTHPGSITSELFIVEGDSAGGSAKQGRDRARQAILPLRGKVLNTEGVSTAKVLENKELADLVTALGCGVGKNFDLARMRYGKVILLADADSDGHHISTLLLTFLYRHLPQLIQAGQGVPGAAAALSHRHRQGDVLGAGRGAEGADRPAARAGDATPEITRFKGLGEMMPKVLWETTLNPRTRRLLKVQVADQLVTDRVINELMGKDASARFRFIMDRAEDAEEIDV